MDSKKGKKGVFKAKKNTENTQEIYKKPKKSKNKKSVEDPNVEASESAVEAPSQHLNEKASPKTKKSKQKLVEQDYIAETVAEPTKKKKKSKKHIAEIEIKDEDSETDTKAFTSFSESVESGQSPKKKKKKIKTNGTPMQEDQDISLIEPNVSASNDINTSYNTSSGDLEELSSKKTVCATAKPSGELSWPQEHLSELIKRMELCCPPNDNLRFKSRLTKLEWDKIAFNNYSVDECRHVWSLIEKKIRGYRLLKEVLQDAKYFVESPAFMKRLAKKHPDMPKKPPSAYFMYYGDNKETIAAKYPNIELTEVNKIMSEMFKNLPLDVKEKYEKMAMDAKKEYQERLEEFYENHPDVPRLTNVTKKLKTVKEKRARVVIPKKPSTPFRLFLAAEMKEDNITDSSKNEFRDSCRQKWQEMSDSQKLAWINLYEEEYNKYELSLKEYMSSHPEHMPSANSKKVLSKKELLLKSRLSGKPTKPPNSAYSLYSRSMLQSEEIKTIPVKERLNYVAKKWASLTEPEKMRYKNLVLEMMEQYKKDFSTYLENLPEEQRELELQNDAPKIKKRKPTDGEEGPSKKAKVDKPKPQPKRQLQEPQQPPVSAYKYFASLYTGEEPASRAWKSLSPADKQRFETELIQKKQEYIKKFEKFLKSLTKAELEEFSNSRRQRAEQANNDEDDETSSDESGNSSKEDSGDSDSD